MPQSPQQASALRALEWLLSDDEEDRGTGRSVVWAVCMLRLAWRGRMGSDGRTAPSREVAVDPRHRDALRYVVTQLGLEPYVIWLSDRRLTMRELPEDVRARLFQNPFPELREDGHRWELRRLPGSRRPAEARCRACGAVVLLPGQGSIWSFPSYSLCPDRERFDEQRALGELFRRNAISVEEFMRRARRPPPGHSTPEPVIVPGLILMSRAGILYRVWSRTRHAVLRPLGREHEEVPELRLNLQADGTLVDEDEWQVIDNERALEILSERNPHIIEEFTLTAGRPPTHEELLTLLMPLPPLDLDPNEANRLVDEAFGHPPRGFSPEALNSIAPVLEHSASVSRSVDAALVASRPSRYDIIGGDDEDDENPV